MNDWREFFLTYTSNCIKSNCLESSKELINYGKHNNKSITRTLINIIKESISSDFEKHKFAIHIYAKFVNSNWFDNSVHPKYRYAIDSARDNCVTKIQKTLKERVFPLARRQLTALRATYYPRHMNHSLLAFARHGWNNPGT